MDENCDLSEPYTIHLKEKHNVVERYRFAKSQLEIDLIFLGKTITLVATRTLRSTWNIISGVFLITLFSILWIFGEL